MANDQNGIGDGIDVEINATGETRPQDAHDKGPDPEVWADPEARDEPEFDDGAGAVKGPGPEWDESAREERGAVNSDDQE